MSEILVQQDNSLVHSLLCNTELGSDFDRQHIGVLHDGSTSLNMLGRMHPNGFDVDIIGWHPLPYTDDGEQRLVNWSRVGHMPEEFQNIAAAGKGIGRRLYSTPDAALGFPGGHDAALFAATVTPIKIVDTREAWHDTTIGKLTRIAQHAGRVAGSVLMGLEHTAQKVNNTYGDAEAVIVGQPPRAAFRQYSRSNAYNESLPPTFAVIRGGKILRRVGVEMCY